MNSGKAAGGRAFRIWGGGGAPLDHCRRQFTRAPAVTNFRSKWELFSIRVCVMVIWWRSLYSAHRYIRTLTHKHDNHFWGKWLPRIARTLSNGESIQFYSATATRDAERERQPAIWVDKENSQRDPKFECKLRERSVHPRPRQQELRFATDASRRCLEHSWRATGLDLHTLELSSHGAAVARIWSPSLFLRGSDIVNGYAVAAVSGGFEGERDVLTTYRILVRILVPPLFLLAFLTLRCHVDHYARRPKHSVQPLGLGILGALLAAPKAQDPDIRRQAPQI
ncbi:hypothetical protein B0H17DRAFT_1139985 [Mycena rosella]|uniref:Uncharacterized protein n=1 Tax=Mycena rosella TaxID=1033263 RepID=A0AAD7G879_MYCRO|nr:hypothetical protein B0H17DRAFT_1139985 [Mycena rosella]